jgi:hypothetical protein
MLLSRQRGSNKALNFCPYKRGVPCAPWQNRRIPRLSLSEQFGIECTKYSEGSIRQTEKRLRPSVGKPQPNGSMPFAALGRAAADEFATYDVFCNQKPEPIPKLASIVAPNFRYSECIRSGRFWTSHGGPTKLHLRREKTSHCIGTSLGGAC